MISAHELISSDGRPRRLRCCGLLLSELARQNGMTFDGKDGEVDRFTTLDGLASAGEGIAITYLTSRHFAGLLRSHTNIAVVTRSELRDCVPEGSTALIVDGNPHDLFYTAFAAAVANGKFERLQPFVSRSARVNERAVIGDNVHIEAGAVIGACAVILPNTYIGPEVGIKSNATVGGDGFENAVIHGRRAIVPHAGGAWLSEGVQVGSSTCIDRGLFGDFSFVGAHTTIDNLVHFAHSAQTGRQCSLVACSEISGATVLGNGVWLGPNASVNQGLSIGDYCYVGTGAVVTRSLPPHSLAYGSPAKVAALVCVCRSKLQFDPDRATCGACGKRYRLDSAGQVHHA